LLSAALLALFAAQGWAAGPTVSVGAGVLSFAPGQTLPAAIRITDIQNVYGFEMELKFDPSVVQVVDADPNAPGVQLLPGDFLSSDLIVRNTADNAAGVIQYAVTQLNPSVPKSGSGTLFTLNIVGGTAGKSGRIEVAKALFATRDGELIPVAASSGEVVVAAQTTVQPTVTTQPSRTPSPTSVPPTATLPQATSTPRPSETRQSTSAPEQASAPTATRSSSAPTLTPTSAPGQTAAPPTATPMASGGLLPTGTPARPAPPAQEQTREKAPAASPTLRPQALEATAVVTAAAPSATAPRLAAASPTSTATRVLLARAPASDPGKPILSSDSVPAAEVPAPRPSRSGSNQSWLLAAAVVVLGVAALGLIAALLYTRHARQGRGG
jgi:hypothetical protein